MYTRRPHARRRGQMLLVVAAFLIAMSGISLLVFDAGTLYQDRTSTLIASDAAALAATQDLMQRFTDNQIQSAVNSYAAQQGAVLVSAFYLDASGAQINAVGNGSNIPFDTWAARGVMVTTSRDDRPGFFLGLFGQNWIQVQSTAKWLSTPAAQPTQFGNPPSGSYPAMLRANVVPLAVPIQALQNAAPNTKFDIWNSQYDASYPGLPAQFKGVFDPDTGNPPLQGSCAACSKGTAATQYTTNGFDGVLAIPESPNATNGLVGSNVSNGLRANITAQGYSDPTGAFGIFLVSVYDSYTAGSPLGTIHLVGVAGMKIYLSDVTGSSAQGTFVNYLDLNGTPGIDAIGGFTLPAWAANSLIRPQ